MNENTKTVNHKHKYCPCTLCADPTNIEDGIIMCIADGCFFKKELSVLDEEKLICTRCKRSFDKDEILDHMCEKEE